MTPTCPECGGSGEIVLLTSRRPCKTCAARRAEGAVSSLTFGPSPFAEAFETFRLMREMEAELFRSFALPRSALSAPP